MLLLFFVIYRTYSTSFVLVTLRLNTIFLSYIMASANSWEIATHNTYGGMKADDGDVA